MNTHQETMRRMQTMRFIGLIITLFVIKSLAGQKCHYEKDMIDAVTEMQIKRTEPIEMATVNEHPLYMKAQCIGPHKYLKIRYFRYNSFEIRAEEPFEIVFNDHSSVKLEARKMPESKNSGGFVKVSSLLVYNLTSAQYKLLLNKPVVQIKYYIESGGYIRKDIRKRYQDDLQFLMRCVLLDSDDF